MWAQSHEPPSDREISRLAAKQHGVVTRKQLLELGFHPKAITYRVTHGRLLPVYRGVYAVGHTRLTPDGFLIAAVFAGGEGALASHRSAADHWGILATSRRQVDVTIPGRARRSNPRIQFHRHVVHRDDRALREGIPLTSVARTLLDLAEAIPRRRLDKAIENAERMRLFDLRAVERVLERSNGRRGCVPLVDAVSKYRPDPYFTRSEAERRFLALIREAALPLPAVNASVLGYEVDFLWAAQRLIVELDGFESHRTRAAFEADRARDAELQLAGYRVIRLTWWRLREDPKAVVELVARLLAV